MLLGRVKTQTKKLNKMLITKEQQEAWIVAYAKAKHTTDECIGFIDGINHTLEKISQLYAKQKAQTEELERWISVDDELPSLNKKEYPYGHTIIASWGDNIQNMAEMTYKTRIVRGKEVPYFEWRGRISPFTVKYWREFPKSPTQTKKQTK